MSTTLASALANEHAGPPVSMGTQHLNTFLNMYFNPNYIKGSERRDHFQLADGAANQIFEDAGKVIRNISIEHLNWINTLLLPARVTRKLEMDITVIRFDRGTGPEQTPNEAVSRYIDMQTETVNFRSKRYGLAFYFELDRMMTPQGQEEFSMFTKEIAKRFKQHAAYVAIARFLQPHSSMQQWYPQYGTHPQQITEDHIRREVAEFAGAHKAETGVFQLIWKYQKAFELYNGMKPDFVMFHSEKQALFKFNNSLLNEYYRGGPDAPGRAIDPDEIANIQGLSFREFPVFPSQCYNSVHDAENSMNAQDVEIGNFFVFRRSAIQNFPDFRNNVHNYIEIFSENKDGMHRIPEREILENCGRFEEDGSLHHLHNDLPDDMFCYNRRPISTFGEMNPVHFPDDYLFTMAETIAKGISAADQERLENVETRGPAFARICAHIRRCVGDNAQSTVEFQARLASMLLFAEQSNNPNVQLDAASILTYLVVPEAAAGGPAAGVGAAPRVAPGVAREEVIRLVNAARTVERPQNPHLGVRIQTLIHNGLSKVMILAAYSVIKARIHLEVCRTMLSHNITLPWDYLIVRPFHSLLMSNLIIAKGGKELGETLIGYGHTGIGWKVVNKTGDLHCTQWIGAYIRDYRLRCIVRNAFHELSYGGGGHTFFTNDQYAAHVQNNFHTPGYDRPSLLGMIIPLNSRVKADFISLKGKLNDQEVDYHYDSWQYYNKRYQFGQINNNRATIIYENDNSPRTNFICFQGTQRQCGNTNGDPGVMTENKGHLGIERTGDREVRQMGLRLKPILNGQPVSS